MSLEKTIEKARLRAKELTDQHKAEVHPVVFKTENDKDFVVGYIKEPPFLVKARAMDKTLLGQGFTAALEILEACTLKEESDPRLLSDTAGNGKYKLGAANYCKDRILLSIDQAEEKKS